MHNLFQEPVVLVRGKQVADTGVESQFDEKTLIHVEKAKGNTVVRHGNMLFFFQPKQRK